ncbi:amino acid adenylation domain-containing protein, partial [Fulvivirga sp.]
MENLLNRLEALGISLAANEDNLDVYDPNENLSEGLISEIKHNKSQLLRLLKISPNTEFKEIPRIPRTSYYPLSSAQSRMHFMQQMEPQTTSYNISKVVTLEEIELERLQRTLHLLTQRHESLRTKFAIINDEPVQIISDNLEIKIELFSEKDGDADKLIHDFIRPFDLHEGPLFRVGLVEKSSGEGLLLLDFHHIIVDGISLDILFKEFSMIYMGQDLAGPKIQYVDYVAWTQSAYYRKDIANQKIFWLKEYAELPSSLDLPTDNNRSENQLKEGQVYRFGFDEALTRSLKELAKANKSTDFMLMYTLYLLFLSKITAQNDVVIGIPTAGRLHADLDEVVGMFTNTLTVRNHIPAESSFEGFLLMVKTKLLQCFENQAYQYEELIDEIKVPRDIHRNPLFDVMFSFQNFKNEPSGKTKNNKKLRLEKSNAKFDLMLTTGTRNEQFYLNLQYDTGLFNSKTIAAFASYMETIARKVVAEPKAPIAELSLLPQDSSRQLADTMKRSIAPEYKMSVIDLFDKNVTSYKNKTALFSEGRSMTYNDLYETSNRIAQVLIKDYGIGKNQLVGVKANRSIELISCLFGILKSGSAYVPIYINDPQDRVAKIATDAGLQIIITDDVDINPNAFPQTQIVQLSGIMEKAQQFDAEPPKVSLNKDDLAYVIYTSGSTGTPKGVMIEHHSLINLIQDLQKRYPLKKDDSYLFKTSCSFDVSVAEIFGWFAEGGSLVILDQGAEEDPSEILSCIDKLKVTHSSFAPSMFSVVVSHLEATGTPSIESLKYVLLAGEVLPMELVKRFNLLEAKAKLENLYGPTEGTVYSSAYSTENIKDEKSVPIGQPISNVEMYIFDEHMNLLPYGIKGELCLGGIGLARGYLNNEDLTQERFVPDPYDSSKRLYKTGDIARIREDGNVEFFGRKDHQLKVHGFRIEAGEIESCLLEYEGITEAVVATKEENEDQYLVAYYVAEEEMDPLTIKNYISDKVSRYMVPAQFVHLAEMPLNASGKIDRKALPDVENTTRDVYEPPANEMEEKMTEIWADILKIDKSRISVTSSFFELGGHSLRATKLVNKVYREMGVQILLKDLFNNKTIRSLSKFVTEGIQTEFVKIEKAEERDSYPLSSAQKRIYFLYEFDKKSTAYNVTTTVRVIGDIDKDKIDKAINKLIERHEILRTTFHLVDDEPVQVIHDTIDFQVETYSLEAGINGSVTKNFIKPFDLAVGPLIRAVLLETPEKDTFLMIDIHHIIADGISKGILFREFKKLLHDKSLPDLKLQYKDYAVWQQGTQQEALAKKQKMFWLNEYSYTLEAIDLPADYERPLFRDYLGSSLDLALEENVGGRIQSITKQNEATYFMFFLTVYNILISKLSGQKDIVIGTPTSGRQHDDLEQLVGMFVNTLAIRNQIKNEYT